VKVIGQDNNGEPIWQLTPEEYQQWKRESAAAREKAKVGMPQEGSIPQQPMKEPEPTSSHPESAAPQSPQSMELGARIWEWRKRGVSVYEIHRKLGIPIEAVKTILEQFERCFYPDVGAALHHYAMLDDQRLEDLMRRWLPVATGPAPEVEKVGGNGKPYTELDNEAPVKAAAIVLGAIKTRIQLLVACRGPDGVNGKDGHGQTSILLWLSQVMPGIQKIVQQVERAPVSRERKTGSRGRQNLVLECEAETEDINANDTKP
jgi:hypothetical protein